MQVKSFVVRSFMLASFLLLGAAASSAGPLAVNRVRFLPAARHEQAMVGGKIQGSNVSPQEGFQTLAEIQTVPAAGQWTEWKFANDKPYRWIRYAAPAGSRGWIAKLEFYADEKKLGGEVFGSTPAGAWRKAFDEKPNPGIQGEQADGQYCGLDVGERASSPRPLIGPVGDDEFSQPISVTLHSTLPKAAIRYTTDGTLPSQTNGTLYAAPIAVDKTTTISAVACCEGLAPSPPAERIFLFHPVGHRHTLHFGNSLTGNAVGKFPLHVRTTGVMHELYFLGMGGGIARTLWNSAMIGPTDPKDEARWKDLFTTTHSMGGVATYPLETVHSAQSSWKRNWPTLTDITDVTFQPRDADIAEEADYTVRWLKVVRERFPAVQPWLYVEWTESNRQRPTDLGTLPSAQMKQVFPALTWEESMSAMMLYGEEVQAAIGRLYPEGKSLRIIPAALAMGWAHRRIEDGQFPDAAPGSFAALLFSDRVHVAHEGAFLVECTWYSALYGQSPEGKYLPLQTRLTARQAATLQHLAWDAVKNYPGAGLYEEGTTPCGTPEFAAAGPTTKTATPVALHSATPGAWFRYTLDGTAPTRTRGYIYCGVVSVRPGMTLKAIAYRSGMADSPMAATSY